MSKQKKDAKYETRPFNALQTVGGAALRQTAKDFDTDTEEVYREIGLVIEASRKSTLPSARAFWDSLPDKGENMTPEEFIAHVTSRLLQKDKAIT